MISRIVVGVDGSANSAAAINWAIALARSLRAEVVAVHAVGLRESAASVEGEERQALEQRFASEWSAALDADGRDVSSRRVLVDGDPVAALLRTVDDVAADIVVVGSRGVGDRPQLLMGSTSTNVAQRSPVPVVVVPPPGA